MTQKIAQMSYLNVFLIGWENKIFENTKNCVKF